MVGLVWYTNNELIFPIYSPNPDVSEWSALVGPQIVNDSEVFEASLDIDRIIISNLSGINAALLKLAKPISYKDFIQPVCMDINNDRSFPVGTPCWVAGWEKGSVSTGKALKHVLNPLLVAKDSIKVCTWGFFFRQ